MRGLLIRWIVLTLAILLAAYLLPGITVGGPISAFLAAAALGILNALFRPILLLVTLPLNILTLGLFTFVINALMLMMASGLIGSLQVRGFWWAVLGSLIITAVSWLSTSLINEHGHVEVISLRKRGGRWE
jgi:putative membrane protein